MNPFKIKSFQVTGFSWTGLWWTPVKVAILIVISWLIYHEVDLVLPKNKDFIATLTSSLTLHWALFVAVIVLLPVNLFFEAVKWKYAVEEFHHLSLKQAFTSILFGNTLGMLTPAKTGEYAGRLIHLKLKESSRGLLANLYCSLAQNSINLLFGAIGFGVLSRFNVLINNNLTLGLLTFVFVFTLLLLVMYFNLEKFLALLPEGFKRKNNMAPLPDNEQYRMKKSKVLQWSLLRYFVYATQYLLICMVFDFDVRIGFLAGGIALIFLLQSLLILPPIMSIIARGETAIFVWSFFEVDVDKILYATITLWLINVLLPSIGGALVFSFHKFRGVNSEN